MVKQDDKTMVRVSKKLLGELKARGKFGESYEDVIWRLIKNADYK